MMLEDAKLRHHESVGNIGYYMSLIGYGGYRLLSWHSSI